MQRIASVVFLVVLVSGCATSSSTASDADAYIRSAVPRFASAFNAGDVNATAAFYTDDAVVLAPNAPAAKGAAAIRQTYGAFFGMHPTLSFGPDSITQSGDMATEIGHYTMTMGAGRDQGNYVAVWRRQSNGDWKMIADSVVSSMPAAH